MVQQAVRAARHLTGLVDNVLRAAGYDVESSTVTPRQDEVDLVELVGEVVDAERGRLVDVHVELLAPDGPVPVRGDREGLAAVVRNLLDNAAHATPPGGRVVVTVGSVAHDTVAVLAVEDQGMGIPPPERQRVFQPFVRLDSYDRGIGLGLHVAAAEARLHGGAVVHTDPLLLSGAHAEVRLPIAGAPEPAQATIESPATLAGPLLEERRLHPPQQIG
jgi:signal transduction histidine kinase